ncbi:MAG: amino acid permease [Methanohalobium sp.]|uniref:amino acid permease n=1 Tax=Methanohalobium sp. TaxID=2837493 RepID=UPI003977F42C
MPEIDTSERLGRSLGFFSTFAIGTGTMIGAGIFILPGMATAAAGPAAILSFIFGGLIAMATAISAAELATGMPRAGGSYYFVSRAMGAVFGTIIGMGAWIGLVFKGSFALVGLGDYFYTIFPVPVLITATIVGFLLLFINYRGAKSSGFLQNVIVITLFIMLSLFIINGFFYVDSAKFHPIVPYGYGSIFATTGLVFISYLGIIKLAAISEEVKDPSKNLPRAFIGSVAAVTILYTGIMIVVNGVLPLEDAVNTETPLVDVANIMLGSTGKIIVVIAGLLATLSTANAAIMSSSRFPFAMGRDDLVPQWFIQIHKKYNTPYRAIMATGLIMIILLFIFDVEQLAKLGSAFNILVFVLVNISAIILRRSSLNWYKPTFRDPFYPVTQIFGILGSLALLPMIGILPFVFAVAVTIAGVLWYTGYGKGKAIPKYNLLDMIESRKIPEKHERLKILVPIANPEHESDLVHLAEDIGDDIIGLHVRKVPNQTSLQAARDEYHEHKPEIDSLLEKQFRRCSVMDGCEHQYIVAFDHDISNSIIEQGNIEKVDLIVVGWHEGYSFIGDIAEKVLSCARKDIIVLKGNLPKKIDSITVAYNDKENSRYALYIVKRIAKRTGSRIKLVRIINPELADYQKNREVEMLERASHDAELRINYEIREDYHVKDAIHDSARDSDILVIGDSSQRFSKVLLGNLSENIAQDCNIPVMIVKRYRPITKEKLPYYCRLRFLKKEMMKMLGR